MKFKVSHTAISERKFLLRALDVVFTFLGLLGAYSFLGFNYIDFNNDLLLTWLSTFYVYFILFGHIFEMYNLQVSSNRYKILRSIFVTAFFTTLFYTFTPYFSPILSQNRIQIVLLFLIISISVTIWRFIYILLFSSPKYFKNIVIIGHSSVLSPILKLTYDSKSYNVKHYFSNEYINGYQGYVNIEKLGIYNKILKAKAREVVVSTKNFPEDIASRIGKDIILLFERGVDIKSYEIFYEELTNRIPKDYLNYNFYNNINLSENLDNKLYQVFTRIFDVILSLIGIIILAVLLPFVIILNLVANKGPLFYTQKRVGKKGKNFTIYKLRSMIPDAEKYGEKFAVKGDKRITPFGRFIRNTRIDEFPQFFNILKGDMSLIGPRPERPNVVKKLKNLIPFYTIRHVVKPGLTGWAQVKYPYAGTIEEQEKKLRYDLYYIKERSLFLDFKIIIKTFSTILFFRGQ